MPDDVDELLRLDPMIAAWAMRHSPRDWQDTAQEGRLGALTALRTYRPREGATPGPWLWLRARGAMVDHLRRTYGDRRYRPRPAHVPLDELHEPHTIERGYSASEARADLRRIGASCTPRERQVLAHLARGLSRREAADALGIAETTAHGAVERVRRRARGAA